MVAALDVQDVLQQGVFDVPADHPLQAEQGILAHVPGAPRDGDIVPESAHLGDQHQLRGHGAHHVQVFGQVLALLRKAGRQVLDQFIVSRRQVEALIADPAVLIACRVHTEEHEVVRDPKAFVQLTGRLPFAQKPDVMHTRCETMPVQVEAVAPAAGHIVLLQHHHALARAGEANGRGQAACARTDDDGIDLCVVVHVLFSSFPAMVHSEATTVAALGLLTRQRCSLFRGGSSEAQAEMSAPNDRSYPQHPPKAPHPIVRLCPVVVGEHLVVAAIAEERAAKLAYCR